MVRSDEISFWDGLYFQGINSYRSFQGCLYIHWFFIDFRGWRSGVIPCSLHSYESLLQKNGRETSGAIGVIMDEKLMCDFIAVCVILGRFSVEGQVDFKTEKP